jgi:antibiotic biosynthesis monooxygenase
MPIFAGLQDAISSFNLQNVRDTMIPRRTIREIPLGSLEPAEQPMTAPFEDAVEIKLCARVVELVAKPEKTDELRGLLCKAVTPLLRDRTGFIRSIVMTTHEEQRRVVVITFWSTDEGTVRDPLEETPLVRELLSPLIDAWSKTRSYKVDLTEATEARSQAISLPIC